MSGEKLYVFRSTSQGKHYYFDSIVGCEGDEQCVEFSTKLDKAHKFTRETLAKFRREEPHIKGRVVLLSTAQQGGAV